MHSCLCTCACRASSRSGGKSQRRGLVPLDAVVCVQDTGGGCSWCTCHCAAREGLQAWQARRRRRKGPRGTGVPAAARLGPHPHVCCTKGAIPGVPPVGRGPCRRSLRGYWTRWGTVACPRQDLPSPWLRPVTGARCRPGPPRRWRGAKAGRKAAPPRVCAHSEPRHPHRASLALAAATCRQSGTPRLALRHSTPARSDSREQRSGGGGTRGPWGVVVVVGRGSEASGGREPARSRQKCLLHTAVRVMVCPRPQRAMAPVAATLQVAPNSRPPGTPRAKHGQWHRAPSPEHSHGHIVHSHCTTHTRIPHPASHIRIPHPSPAQA